MCNNSIKMIKYTKKKEKKKSVTKNATTDQSESESKINISESFIKVFI